MPGSHEWGKCYHHQQDFMENGKETTPNNISGGFSDAVTTSSAIATESTGGSPSSSHNGGQLTPTGSVSKPIRRRSRVSKKTPITLLNASATNFRALVQQFTGCAASSAPISFGSQKGPINLSFGPNNGSTSSLVTHFGNRNYNQYQYQQQQLQRFPPPPQQVLEQQQQQRPPLVQLQENNQQFRHEQQQRMYPIDNVSGSNDHVFQYPSSGGYNLGPSVEVVDGLMMDQEDIALHEFSGDLFSN